MLIISYVGDEKPDFVKLEKTKDNVLIVDLWALAMGLREDPDTKEPTQGIYTLAQYSAFNFNKIQIVFDTKKFRRLLN